MKDDKKEKKKLGQPFYVNKHYIINKIVPSIIKIIILSFINFYFILNKTNTKL